MDANYKKNNRLITKANEGIKEQTFMPLLLYIKCCQLFLFITNKLHGIKLKKNITIKKIT